MKMICEVLIDAKQGIHLKQILWMVPTVFFPEFGWVTLKF